MKKIITKFWAMMAVVVCVLSLVACDGIGLKPNLNLDDAARLLKQQGYNVVYIDNESECELGEVAYLRATKMTDTMSSIGMDQIYIYVFKTEKMAKLYFERAKHKENSKYDSIIYIAEKNKILIEELKDFYDSEDIAENEENYKKLLELAEKDKRVVGRKGKFVWLGTKQAIIDSKKSV